MPRAQLVSFGVALVAAAAAPARADGDRALSVGLGYATFSAPGIAMGGAAPPAVSPEWGVTGDVVYEHGISTDFSLRGELALATFRGGLSDPKKQSEQSYAAIGDVGFVFRFDVLKYVPFAFAGVGGVTATGGPLSTTGLQLSLGGGLDVLIDRGRSVGFEARLSSWGSELTVFTLGVRYSTRWGYF